jgi:PleD family two-component response regulator
VKTAETVLRIVSFDLMGALHDRSVAVLIVEDEFLIRMDTASFLESAGFVVYEAEHADEAIRCLEAHDEIRLIFTDVICRAQWMDWRWLITFADGGLRLKSS